MAARAHWEAGALCVGIGRGTHPTLTRADRDSPQESVEAADGCRSPTSQRGELRAHSFGALKVCASQSGHFLETVLFDSSDSRGSHCVQTWVKESNLIL